MKTIIIFFTCAALTVISFSQDLLTNNIKEIKKITEYKYISQNNSVILIDSVIYQYNADGKANKIKYNISEPVNIITFNYDVSGRISEKTMFNNLIKTYTYKYTYDKSGKLTKESCYDKDGKILFTNSLKYDDKNRLVRKKSNISTRFEMNYYYDANNNNSKTVIFGNSAMKKEIEYVYDSKDNIIQETVYQSLKKSKNNKRYQVTKIKFVYNDSGRLTQKINYITDEITDNFYYSYNDDGTLAKWEKFNPQNKVEYSVKYVYEK